MTNTTSLSVFRPLVHERDEQLHRQRRTAIDATLLLCKVEVDYLLVTDIEL